MKKLIAILISLTLIFSFMAVPASAALDNSSDTTVSITGVKSIFERISDFFHNLIANIFESFGMECPVCDNHDGYTEADGDGTYTKNEIINMYNEAVNSLKAYKKTLKLEHTSILNADVVDAPSSIKNVVESVLDDLTGKNIATYSFKYNENAKISAVIPPEGREAKLNVAYVDYINYTRINDYGKIEFRLKDSESHFDGTDTTAPLGYADVLQPIDLSATDYITEADITYKNTVVEATIDINGKLSNITVSSDITVDATAVIGSTQSKISVVLDCTDQYNVIY